MLAAVFDVEANGLISNSGINIEKQPRLIEFYGCLVQDDGKIQHEFYSLFNPEIKLEKKVTEITGITNEAVAKAPKFVELIPAFEEFFFEADAVVAHNLSYDKAIMDFELTRAGIKPELFWPEIKICTVEATEYFKGYRLSLTELHSYLFKAGFIGAHRAKADVQATIRCYVELVKQCVI